jgi:hypothetical protein
VNELFAMSASISRTLALLEKNDPEAQHAVELCDLFCRTSARRVDELFGRVWANDDAAKVTVAQGVLDGRQLWMEQMVDGLAPAPRADKDVAKASK